MKTKILIFLVFLSCNILAQKADDQKLTINYTKIPRYQVAGNTFKVNVNGSSDMRDKILNQIKKLKPFGKEYKTDSASICIEFDIEKIYVKDSINESINLNSKKEYVIDASVNAVYVLRILDSLNNELVSYNLQTKTLSYGSIPQRYGSRESAEKGVRKEYKAKIPALKKELAEYMVEQCDKILDTTFSNYSKPCIIKMFTGKGKKFNYTDLDTAFFKFTQAMELYKTQSLSSEVKVLVNQAIEIWNKASQEFVKDSKESRISVLNIGEIYLNLATAYLIINNCQKSKEMADIALQYDNDYKYEKNKIKQLAEEGIQNASENEKFQAKEKKKKTQIYRKPLLNEMIFATIFNYHLSDSFGKHSYLIDYFPYQRSGVSLIQEEKTYKNFAKTENVSYRFDEGILKAIEIGKDSNYIKSYKFKYWGGNLVNVSFNNKVRFEFEYGYRNRLETARLVDGDRIEALWRISYPKPDSISVKLAKAEGDLLYDKKVMIMYFKYNDNQMITEMKFGFFSEEKIEYDLAFRPIHSVYQNLNDAPDKKEFAPIYKFDNANNWIEMENNDFIIKRKIFYDKQK